MFGPKAMKGFFGGVAQAWVRPQSAARGGCSRGDLKYVILDMLEDEPSGYEVIRKLEESPADSILRVPDPFTPHCAARRHGVRERHPAGRQESLRHHGRRTEVSG